MFLQFLSARNANRVVRMKGVFRCEGQRNALVVNGVHQWLEFGPIKMAAPQTSQFVVGLDLTIVKSVEAGPLSWIDTETVDLVESAGRVVRRTG